jgi:hypothetical protein
VPAGEVVGRSVIKIFFVTSSETPSTCRIVLLIEISIFDSAEFLLLKVDPGEMPTSKQNERTSKQNGRTSKQKERSGH